MSFSSIQLPPVYKKFSPRISSIDIGICSMTGKVELECHPRWSCLLSVKPHYVSADIPGINYNTISMEGRHYFDGADSSAPRRSFASLRVGTSKNIGAALGLKFSPDHIEHGSMTVHIGGYTNLRNLTEIKPTMGVSFGWGEFY